MKTTPHADRPNKAVRPTTDYSNVEETLKRLHKLEAEVAELIARIKWNRYLGYDKRGIEFVKHLQLGKDH